MNAILGFAQLLQLDKKEPLSARHRERADQILKGGEHLLRLIDDILDLSRIEAGGISMSTEPVGLVEGSPRSDGHLATASNVARAELGARDAFGRPTDGGGRSHALQANLNELRVQRHQVQSSRGQGRVRRLLVFAERVRVTVRDTGMGIPAEKQAKLFQPFQRAGQETGPIEGTGIGLVITKRLAELMGGEVGFRSVPGEGSDFWVDMPVHVSEARPSEPAQAIESAAQRFSGHRLVLYVEDNPANVTFMKDLMSSFESIDLLTVPTAEMGIEVAQARHPEVIIMDINLPGMSGVEALRALQAAPDTKDIPVIALTAAASEHDRQRGIQAGFHRYITKPVKVDELLSVLEALLAASPA